MYEGPLQRLVDELSRLPGIGGKSAQRIAFHLLSIPDTDARRLGQAILELRDQVRHCNRCFNVTVSDECAVCRDGRRDTSIVCVVERPQDIIVVEKTQEYRGLYHVLGGSLSPINGIGPDQLRIPELRKRFESEQFTEMIIATNPTMEGDATAMYLAKEFKPKGVRVSRLASGLPVGGDLDYADELTLGRALIGRMEM
ncbi:MAG: recombination mediator RecR [Acidimicrobiia bacterium]|nr:recombination mediator RecR [Acidimicrobiia bacterium]